MRADRSRSPESAAGDGPAGDEPGPDEGGDAGARTGEGALRTADFDYDLPDGRIARFPTDRRDESRLLAVRRGAGGGEGRLEDRRFRELADLVPAGDALVLNDTRVLPARLLGTKPTGADGEVLLLRPLEEEPGEAGARDAEDAGAGAAGPGGRRSGPGRRWRALVRPGGKLKPGRTLVVADDLRVEIEDFAGGGGRIVRLEGEGDPRALIERHGEMPIPPYLDRPSVPLDRERYQTVYAEEEGSVAAPTAGLHFTDELLERLEAKGVRLVRITLHVGVGTFRPVDAERPEDHELHEERYEVRTEAARALNEVRDGGGAIWAVGTTATRTLETVADDAGRIRPGSGVTDLFIHPPHRFRAVDRLITNFHLPRSSLLMLVSAFGGHERTMRAYRHAVEAGYRFYSYGDAMAVV